MYSVESVVCSSEWVRPKTLNSGAGSNKAPRFFHAYTSSAIRSLEDYRYMDMKRMVKNAKYNSVVNVVGSIPDYAVMIDYINSNYGTSSEASCFTFRTAKATSRFEKAVSDGFMLFASEDHKKLFLDALASSNYRLEEKMLILFWQLIYTNNLFRQTTDNVFLRFLYSGRTSLELSDVEAYLKHLKTTEPDEISFSDNTLKTIASKYLTVLKKFGMADGSVRKTIKAPHISSALFAYLVRFALAVYPEENTIHNPMFRYSFLDNTSIINRLKAIECMPLWDITQIGNDIKITLK